MSLERSPRPRSIYNNPIGEASNAEQGNNDNDSSITIDVLLCFICKELLPEGQEYLTLRQCLHTFHRKCIEEHLSSSTECPSCKVQCNLTDLKINSLGTKSQHKPVHRRNNGKGRGAMAKHYNTRYAEKNQLTEQANLLDFSPDVQGAVGMTPTPQNRTNELSQDNSRPLQQPSLYRPVDYGEIQKMVETSLCSLLTSLKILPNNQPGFNHTNLNQVQIDESANLTSNSNRNNNSNSHSNSNNSPRGTQASHTQTQSHLSTSTNHFSVSNLPIQPDKITTIIQNWHLKFDGSPTGLTVDEFLYRVTTLTEDNFNGDFSLICRNLNILLSGKAREWYWRYRKNATRIIWEEFCDAIKFQYRDFKTSFDIREEIRNRKQRNGESFDSFFEAVTAIHDRLPTQMPELELIEILTRNLRPEIRQELLYIPINSLAHLRKLVHMRENFLNDDYVRKQLSNRPVNVNPIKRQVSEISDYPVESEEETFNSINSIQNLSHEYRCWNCDEKGHLWENCLNERKIFCYGCGAKDTYKPNCTTCSEAKLKFQRNFRQGTLPKKNP